MLENLLSETKTISYTGCLVQCFFFIALVHVEVFILAVMAFDRHMAIGNPLLYGSKMSRAVCIRLISFPYVYGFLISLAATLWTYGLYFCGKIEINYFYCADPPLIKMACAGTFVKEYTMLILAGINSNCSYHILPVHPHRHSTDELCGREAQGLLHLWVPCSKEPLFSCISDVPQGSLWSRGRWWLCFTPR